MDFHAFQQVWPGELAQFARVAVHLIDHPQIGLEISRLGGDPTPLKLLEHGRISNHFSLVPLSASNP